LLGIKYGKWQFISSFKGVSIKYTILTDRNRSNQAGAGMATQIFAVARFSNNQYNKEETWLVHIYTQDNKKIQILNTDKKNALTAIIYLLKTEDNITPYLANCRPEFELSKPNLMKGLLTLLNPRDVSKRR
jgi:hypothetical protein